MKKAKVATHRAPQYLSALEGKILIFISMLLIVSIFYSKAMITICMIGFVLLSLRHISLHKIHLFMKDRTMMPFMLVFFVAFLSGSYSENHSDWMTALRVKLPFLILPFTFFALPKMKEWVVIQIHHVLILICVIVGATVLWTVYKDHDGMLELLAKGQPIPTPIEHVKYSMFNAYAAMSGIILLFERKKVSQPWYRWILISSSVLLILLLHILAVRTGLVILYSSIMCYIGYLLIKGSSRLHFLLLFVILIITPLLCYQLLPSLKQKVAYMKYDWLMYDKGAGAHYSDSERIMSYKAGWDIWKKNPIIGAGYGDIRDLAKEYYISTYDRSDFNKLPHSQFLLTLGGSGILGLLIFISGFYTPLLSVNRKSLSSMLFVYLIINYSLSFLVENSLERSISVAFFIFIALLLIKAEDDPLKRYSL